MGFLRGNGSQWHFGTKLVVKTKIELIVIVIYMNNVDVDINILICHLIRNWHFSFIRTLLLRSVPLNGCQTKHDRRQLTAGHFKVMITFRCSDKLVYRIRVRHPLRYYSFKGTGHRWRLCGSSIFMTFNFQCSSGRWRLWVWVQYWSKELHSVGVASILPWMICRSFVLSKKTYNLFNSNVGCD